MKSYVSADLFERLTTMAAKKSGVRRGYGVKHNLAMTHVLAVDRKTGSYWMWAQPARLIGSTFCDDSMSGGRFAPLRRRPTSK
jgi:hypothetical protein